MTQFKHCYYMMEVNTAKDVISNEQLEIYENLIKTITNKQVKKVKPYKIEDAIDIYKLTDDYSIRIYIIFDSANYARIRYYIQREDIVYHNGANIHVELNENENTEHLLVIPLGGERTLLMFNCFQAITSN